LNPDRSPRAAFSRFQQARASRDLPWTASARCDSVRTTRRHVIITTEPGVGYRLRGEE